VALFTRPASVRRDALFWRRSQLARILTVPHLENKRLGSVGWAGEKCYASGACSACGLAGQPF
jgi:hypothetical protein